MLKLRREQIAVFQRKAAERDIDEFCATLRERYPDFRDRRALRQEVQGIVSTAQHHGLVSKADIHAFVIFKLVLGVAVEQTPEFRAVVEDASVHPHTRMLVLARRAKPAFWRQRATPPPATLVSPSESLKE